MKLAFLVLATLTMSLLPQRVATASKPNIVLIFIDDLGYADIGPFGNRDVRTPNLDRFAAEGRKFTSFYATPVCSMSRACLMTGCYNVRVSIPGVLFPKANIGLNTNEITLAEIVKSKGYATCAIGKWHLGHHPEFLPTRQGFDQYLGLPYSNDMTIDPVNARFAKDCVFLEGMTETKAREGAVKNVVPLMRGEEVVEYPADQSQITKRYTEEAVRFIREHTGEPFFVYLPHTMIHHPLAASDAFKDKSKQGLLGDAIEEIDWSVGKIMATLKELKLDDNTLVIFTSDNGPAGRNAPPFRGNKGTTWEGGVREPCMMRWPGKIPAGTTCDQISGNIDMLPTFAALVGSDVPKDRVIDGRDISPLMFEATPGPVRDTHLYFSGNGKLEAVRQGRWKLFLTKSQGGGKIARATNNAPNVNKEQKDGEANSDEFTLYDLATDLGETMEVSADHRDIVAKLKSEAALRDTEIREHQRPAGEHKETK